MIQNISPPTVCATALVCDESPPEAQFCYICFAGSSHEDPLKSPCKCPRPVHLRCLARWNLQSAGGEEEQRCRFCLSKLPDWKETLSTVDVRKEAPVMALKFEGKVYKMRVRPGPECLADFQRKVRSILGFNINDGFEVSFEANLNGETIRLSGMNSYAAATHCAAITAAERRKNATAHKSSSSPQSPPTESKRQESKPQGQAEPGDPPIDPNSVNSVPSNTASPSTTPRGTPASLDPLPSNGSVISYANVENRAEALSDDNECCPSPQRILPSTSDQASPHAPASVAQVAAKPELAVAQPIEAGAPPLAEAQPAEPAAASAHPSQERAMDLVPLPAQAGQHPNQKNGCFPSSFKISPLWTWMFQTSKSKRAEVV
eukprot:gene2-12806_t